MMRIIGTELRRSNAPTLFLLFVVVSVALLVLNGDEWHKQWLTFGWTQGSGMLLLFPLALAGGAVLGRREKRTKADELLASTGRPRAQRLLTGMIAVAAAAVAAHLLVFVGAGLLPLLTGSYVDVTTSLWPASSALVLVGGVWLGMAAGRAWASPLVPPLLAVVGVLQQVGFSEIGGPVGKPSPLRNLSLLAQPPGYDWEAVQPKVLIGWAILGLGLVVTAFLLVAGRSWVPRVAAVAVLAVAGTVAAQVPGVWQRDHYRVDAAAQKLVCTDDAGPQVCVTAVHAWALDEAAPEIRRGLQLLAKLPNAPQRAVEWHAYEVYGFDDTTDWQQTGTTRPGPGTLHIDLDLDSGKLGDSLVENIVLGAGTTWSGCRGGKDAVAGHVAGNWLMGTDQLRGIDDGIDSFPEMQAQIAPSLAALRALPEPEQIKRVTAMRDAALNCDEDLLPILTGKASA